MLNGTRCHSVGHSNYFSFQMTVISHNSKEKIIIIEKNDSTIGIDSMHAMMLWIYEIATDKKKKTHVCLSLLSSWVSFCLNWGFSCLDMHWWETTWLLHLPPVFVFFSKTSMVDWALKIKCIGLLPLSRGVIAIHYNTIKHVNVKKKS